MDYFNARNLLARTGRMNAPDPLFSGAVSNPQRWNRYAYAGDNPLRFLDPSGRELESLSSDNAWRDPDDMTGYLMDWKPSAFSYEMRTLSAQGFQFDWGGGGESIVAFKLGTTNVSIDEQAKISPHVNAVAGWPASVSANEIFLMAAETYGEAPHGNAAQYKAMASVQMNVLSVTTAYKSLASGSGTTMTSVLADVATFQAVGNKSYQAAIYAYSSGNPNGQMQLALEAAEFVVEHGAVTTATAFTHYGVKPAGGFVAAGVVPGTPPLYLWNAQLLRGDR